MPPTLNLFFPGSQMCKSFSTARLVLISCCKLSGRKFSFNYNSTQSKGTGVFPNHKPSWVCHRYLNNCSNEIIMNQIKEEKAVLREEMKARLAKLTTEVKKRQSDIVKSKLFAHEVYQRSQRVCIFLNLDDEIQTLDILKEMLDKQKTVFIPRYSGKLGRMDMMRLTSWEDYESLPLTRWNIKQPSMKDVREDALETGGLDLAIMPGLAFTKQGHRLGRGKGYYDAFLTRCANTPKGKPYTIAVAFKEQVLPHVPTGETDVLINEVLSDD